VNPHPANFLSSDSAAYLRSQLAYKLRWCVMAIKAECSIAGILELAIRSPRNLPKKLLYSLLA